MKYASLYIIGIVTGIFVSQIALSVKSKDKITLTPKEFMLAYRCGYGRGELAGLTRQSDQWSNRDSAIVYQIYFGK